MDDDLIKTIIPAKSIKGDLGQLQVEEEYVNNKVGKIFNPNWPESVGSWGGVCEQPNWEDLWSRGFNMDSSR